MKTIYVERFYRGWCIGDKDKLVSYSIKYGYSDVFIKTDVDCSLPAGEMLKEIYEDIVKYSKEDTQFLSALSYYDTTIPKPEVVNLMFETAKQFDVGPMAAVAGAVSQVIGEKLLKYSNNVIVENGGDIFAKSSFEITIGIFAGNSPFSGRVGIKVKSDGPIGICTSSGTVGPSKSFGIADAAVVVARDAAVADAGATALGNLVNEDTNIGWLLEEFVERHHLLGGVIIKGGEMSVYKVELISI